MSAAILPDPSSLLPAFEWDIVTSEVHEATNEPTEYPVETGVDITDHVRIKPAQVTITGNVTNTPIVQTTGSVFGPTVIDVPVFVPPPLSSEAALISAAGNAIKNAIFGPPPPTIVEVLQFPVPINPIKDAHNLLLVLKESRVFCQVATSTITYSNMVITSVTMRQQADEGDAEFTVILKEVITVTSATVAAPKPLIPAGQPKTAGGTQTPPPADDAAKKTALKTIVDSAGKAAGAVGALF